MDLRRMREWKLTGRHLPQRVRAHETMVGEERLAVSAEEVPCDEFGRGIVDLTVERERIVPRRRAVRHEEEDDRLRLARLAEDFVRRVRIREGGVRDRDPSTAGQRHR